ncbi:hypothetical protein TWF281_002133 [Arthrobotrys megalospora]
MSRTEPRPASINKLPVEILSKIFYHYDVMELQSDPFYGLHIKKTADRGCRLDLMDRNLIRAVCRLWRDIVLEYPQLHTTIFCTCEMPTPPTVSQNGLLTLPKRGRTERMIICPSYTTYSSGLSGLFRVMKEHGIVSNSVKILIGPETFGLCAFTKLKQHWGGLVTFANLPIRLLERRDYYNPRISIPPVKNVFLYDGIAHALFCGSDILNPSSVVLGDPRLSNRLYPSLSECSAIERLRLHDSGWLSSYFYEILPSLVNLREIDLVGISFRLDEYETLIASLSTSCRRIIAPGECSIRRNQGLIAPCHVGRGTFNPAEWSWDLSKLTLLEDLELPAEIVAHVARRGLLPRSLGTLKTGHCRESTKAFLQSYSNARENLILQFIKYSCSERGNVASV